MTGGTIEALPPQLRARLAARFPNCPWWREPVEPPAPWELIRTVLAKGREDGLDDRQLAAAVYTVLVGRGLLDGGHA
ncbi:MAG UNVERIFIED_CONTAM: hypothetical protein MIO30_17420 [Methylobacterium ajmalii]